MRFLDLDLDFFLNKNAYSSGIEGSRLGSEYQPWPGGRVRNFLEGRCGLSLHTPVPGRTVTTHDGIITFWRELIDTVRIVVPFDVVHVDAHPDMCWGGAAPKETQIHAGNYLSFAVAYGWIKSLTWVSLTGQLESRMEWDADARQKKNLSVKERATGIRYKVFPWQRFKTTRAFDYIALSQSPEFTPLESDKLIPVIKEYMKLI